MTIRFISPLLIVALLLGLNACSTTSTAPPSGREPQTPIETGDKGTHDQYTQELLNPTERSLAAVSDLTGGVSAYQADTALEALRLLEPVSSAQLNAIIDKQTESPELTAWLKLALQVRMTMMSSTPTVNMVQNWETDRYDTGITRVQFNQLVSRYRATFSTPSRVAILLPVDGELAAAARAIRDGIISAYLERPGESTIQFYSSGETGQSAIEAYMQARQDGATQIIGPLHIASTQALASLNTLDTPVLLLNEAPENTLNTHAVVNSLSLSQTEEAAAIAARSLAQGYKRAIVIFPNTDWGARIETAFSQAFESNGGQITDKAQFYTSVSDHSVTLTQLLKINESEDRKTALQTRLGIPLGFEATRRDDFDFIFLAANPQQGRELKPLLRFHNTGDIPVYAMGRVFSGKVQPATDQDLNDIVFPTTPWQIQSSADDTQTPVSIHGGSFGNLYALGEDAWSLLPWLPLMQKDPDLWFSGNIGGLRLEQSGRLSRTPAWAQFSAGRPIPYEWPVIH